MQPTKWSVALDDLQACEKAAAEQLIITKTLQKATVHFRCQRHKD